ncbi:hypothetical protein C0J52_21871, partial [Blattella germanica]
ENTLRINERKIIRKLFGRLRSNLLICEILKGADLVRLIKSLRPRLLGHLERMEMGRMLH